MLAQTLDRLLARHTTAVICVVLGCAPMCHAATDPVGPVHAADSAANVASPTAVPATDIDLTSSGSSSSVAAESTATDPDLQMRQPVVGTRPTMTGVAPFSTAAIQIKLGVAGPGLDVAVPVAGRMNLRAGGSFFSYNPNLVEDGINVIGNIQLRSASANVDFFPFGNAFRISPGVVFYNGNQISAVASVAAGQTFTLNNVTYYSSAAAPVAGTFGLSFGKKVAPSLTMGFGNMIPRKGGHWSVPVEIGAEYIGTAPQISLALSGTACQGSATTNCAPIASNPATQQNLVAEQASLNSNIPSQLRFYPILSIGLSYKFGHGNSAK
jgi:hypothetical protein